MSGIERLNNRVYPLKKGGIQQPGKTDVKGEKTFEEALASARINLSKHAQWRMQDRKINLDTLQMEKLNRAMTRARDKGIRDTLIVMDDKVFVVNVKSNTVITAASEKDVREKIFTNIDGAVIV